MFINGKYIFLYIAVYGLGCAGCTVLALAAIFFNVFSNDNISLSCNMCSFSSLKHLSIYLYRLVFFLSSHSHYFLDLTYTLVLDDYWFIAIRIGIPKSCKCFWVSVADVIDVSHCKALQVWKTIFLWIQFPWFPHSLHAFFCKFLHWVFFVMLNIF